MVCTLASRLAVKLPQSASGKSREVAHLTV